MFWLHCHISPTSVMHNPAHLVQLCFDAPLTADGRFEKASNKRKVQEEEKSAFISISLVLTREAKGRIKAEVS